MVFAYMTDMILERLVPYCDIWNHKMPLIYYPNAVLFRIFNSSFKIIALFEIVRLLIPSIFIYNLSDRISKRKSSLFINIMFTIYASSLELAMRFGMTETYSILASTIAVSYVKKYVFQ